MSRSSRRPSLSDAIAIEFLKNNGLHPVVMPQMGDFGAALGGAFGGGIGLFGGEALICVPRTKRKQRSTCSNSSPALSTKMTEKTE